LVAFGADSQQLLVTALGLRPEESLAGVSDVHLPVPSANLAPLHFVVRPDAARGPGVSPSHVVRSLAGTLKPGPGGVEVTAQAQLAAQAGVNGPASLFPQGLPLSSAALASADAVILGHGQWAADPAGKLARAMAPSVWSTLQHHASRMGADLQDSMPVITDGHFAGAVYAASVNDIAQHLRHNNGPDWFGMGAWVVLLRVKPGTTAQAWIARLGERLRARGLAVESEKAEGAILRALRPGDPLWRAQRAAVVQDMVMLGGGDPATFMAALQRLRAGQPAQGLAPDELEMLSKPQGSTILLRPHVALEKLDQLLRLDWTGNAETLTVRALLQKARKSAEKFKRIAIQMNPEGENLRMRFQLLLQEVTP
jgi:hypothetical protein